MELVIIIPLSAILLEYFIVFIYCTNGEGPVDNKKSKQRTEWNDEDKIKLLKIFYETDTDEWGHDKRIKKEWDRLGGSETPKSAHNLYTRATTWIKNGEAEKLLSEEDRHSKKYEPRRNINWTEEMKENILKFYHVSNPDKWRQSKKMKELWDKEYPDHRNVTSHNLMAQARRLLLKRGEISSKKISLKREEKIDLLHFYHMTPENSAERIKLLKELFIKKYPQYANTSHDTLRYYVSTFRKKHPEIEEKILANVSGLDTVHSSREPGETSSRVQGESTSITTFRNNDFPGESEQYFDPNRDNAWINDMIREGSFSNYQALPDIDTDPSASHQDILQYPENIHTCPDVDGSHRVNSSRQHHPKEKKKSSSKGKELVLD